MWFVGRLAEWQNSVSNSHAMRKGVISNQCSQLIQSKLACWNSTERYDRLVLQNLAAGYADKAVIAYRIAVFFKPYEPAYPYIGASVHKGRRRAFKFRNREETIN